MIPYNELKIIIGGLMLGYFFRSIPALVVQMKQMEALEEKLRREGK